MPLDIPARKNEAAFRRYAAIITKAVEDFPSPVRLPGRPTGIMQPLRDAIKGKRQYGWQWPTLDDARFFSVVDKLKVYEHDGSAWLGPVIPKEPLMPAENGTALYQLVEPAMLDTLCRLVGTGALRPMPCFIVAGVPALARQALADSFQVEFVPVSGKDGFYQLI